MTAAKMILAIAMIVHFLPQFFDRRYIKRVHYHFSNNAEGIIKMIRLKNNKKKKTLFSMKQLLFAEQNSEKVEGQYEQMQSDKKRMSYRKTSFFGNLKIGKKLLLGFLIIALICIGIGIYASINIIEVSDSASNMYESILMPVINVSTLYDTFNEGCINLRQALLADESKTVVYLKKLKATSLSYASTLSMLEDLVSEESMKSLNTLRLEYDKYYTLLNQAMAEIEAGNKDQVLEDIMYSGELKIAEGKVVGAIGKFKYWITENATDEATASKRTSQSVVKFNIIGMVIVTILSILIGIFTARGISRPIKKLTEKVKKLAAGDTNITFSEISNKDEIGQMRDAIGTITKSIKTLESDTAILIESAKEGDLNVRVDVEKHQGIYRDIVDGFNTTLDAMIAPIKESIEVLSKLADGNLEVSVTGEFKGDYALIKDALNTTVGTVKRYIDEVTDILEHIAQGNMTVSIISEYKGGFVRLKDSINTSIVAFNDVLTEIDTASTQVASGSRQVSDGSQTISQGATEQAAEIDQLTSTVIEIAAQADQNAKNANNANDLVKTAKTDASAGNSQMEKMQEAMVEIKAASESISKIIKVIDDIAFQTNILALNAAVEAARAGFYGKGFAVVANEVKNLAARSAQAAKETTELIENSIAIVGSGTKIADQTADALSNIVSGVDKAAELVAQIAVASNEQVVGITQINNSIDEMVRVVQTNSATSEETAAASEELSSQAEMLREMVSKFQLRGKNDAYIGSTVNVKAIGRDAKKEIVKVMTNNELID